MDIFIDKFLDRTGHSYKIAYYPTELTLYFEKHHIFEIVFDLMVMLEQDRPSSVEEYIAENIESVAKKYKQINSYICIPDKFDAEDLTLFQAEEQHCPVIIYDGSFNCETFVQQLTGKLQKFKLDDKNLIMLGDRKSLHQAKQSGIHFHQLFGAKDAATLRKLHSHVLEQSRLLKTDPHHAVVKYVKRIVVLGRSGCGKHRIGKWIAKRCNLCLVSATDLLAQHVREFDSFGKALNVGCEENVHSSELIASIVQHRLLQPDCLANGWVLVDFPNIAHDVFCFSKLLIFPKQVLVINADESVCRRRKLRRKSDDPTVSNCWRSMVFETESKFYDAHEQQLLEAFDQQKDCAIIRIDGNCPFSNIKAAISKKMMINPECRF